MTLSLQDMLEVRQPPLWLPSLTKSSQIKDFAFRGLAAKMSIGSGFVTSTYSGHQAIPLGMVFLFFLFFFMLSS